MARTGSTFAGLSTLTTRAPRSASCIVAYGEARKTPTSSTVVPVSGALESDITRPFLSRRPRSTRADAGCLP